MYLQDPIQERSSTAFLPSPASYSPHVQFSDPKCVFGRAKRDIDHQEAVPGPASYEIGDLRPVTPAFTLGIRFKQSPHSVGPGPCSYRVESGSMPTPRWSFGCGKRWQRSSETIPGPADYNTMSVHSFRTSPAFSLKSRPKHSQGGDTFPGPGAYADCLTQFE